ncbi:MAG TPA: hypothetical protein PKA58_24880, partial [Polyangium sp.]|nr:hypothetical protein [Polyangium sp.]
LKRRLSSVGHRAHCDKTRRVREASKHGECEWKEMHESSAFATRRQLSRLTREDSRSGLETRGIRDLNVPGQTEDKHAAHA